MFNGVPCHQKDQRSHFKKYSYLELFVILGFKSDCKARWSPLQDKCSPKLIIGISNTLLVRG